MVRAQAINVLSAGFVCADLVLKPVDDLPPAGGNRFVQQAGLAIGGCAANAAINLARLGCTSALAGRVGDDALGAFLRDALAARGVDCGHLLVTGGASSAINTALVSATGERSFYVFAGACDLVVPDDLPDSLLSRFDHLHLAAVGALPGLVAGAGAAVAQRARALGLTISLDVTLNPHRDPAADILPLLAHVDAFLPNLGEARAVLGVDSIESLLARGLDLGLRLMGIKLGERGCVLATSRERADVPAFAVPVVDSSGAGDAWSAAVVYGWLHGWPLARLGRFANAAGALSTLGMGATGGIVGVETVERFLESRPERPA